MGILDSLSSSDIGIRVTKTTSSSKHTSQSNAINPYMIFFSLRIFPLQVKNKQLDRVYKCAFILGTVSMVVNSSGPKSNISGGLKCWLYDKNVWGSNPAMGYITLLTECVN
jgi:hypothetical protein